MGDIDIHVSALPLSCREKTQALLRAARTGGCDMAVVESAVQALADEIHRSRDEAAGCRVDRDRGIQAAMRTAEDCQWHGKDLRRLYHEVYAYNTLGARYQEERGIWLSTSWRLRDALTGRDDDLSRAVVDVLAKADKAVAAAHRRYQAPSQADCERAGRCKHPEPPPHVACEQLRLDIEAVA